MRIAGVLIYDKWGYREAARRLYPRNQRLQRKWLRAYRQAPGVKVQIGPLPEVHA